MKVVYERHDAGGVKVAVSGSGFADANAELRTRALNSTCCILTVRERKLRRRRKRRENLPKGATRRLRAWKLSLDLPFRVLCRSSGKEAVRSFEYWPPVSHLKRVSRHIAYGSSN